MVEVKFISCQIGGKKTDRPLACYNQNINQLTLMVIVSMEHWTVHGSQYDKIIDDINNITIDGRRKGYLT